MDEFAASEISRDEAIMEGHRMLMDNLREKVILLEGRCDKLGREKKAVEELLANRKEEYLLQEEELNLLISELEEKQSHLEAENSRLIDRLKLPESERASISSSEKHITSLQRKIQEASDMCQQLEDDNANLKQEIKDLNVEMEEMHDQFREDEAAEFREIQKDLEATAKNCRILQFKLRKSERRNEQVEADRMQYEEKIRLLESRFESSNDKQHINDLQEELKMAKEVSVRLHDELEMVEERRIKYEEELRRSQDYLSESEASRLLLQQELEEVQNEVSPIQITLCYKIVNIVRWSVLHRWTAQNYPTNRSEDNSTIAGNGSTFNLSNFRVHVYKIIIFDIKFS